MTDPQPTQWERITAEQAEPGDRIALTRTAPPLRVECIESIGASSRYIRVTGPRGQDRLRPRHTTKFWRVVT